MDTSAKTGDDAWMESALIPAIAPLNTRGAFALRTLMNAQRGPTCARTAPRVTIPRVVTLAFASTATRATIARLMWTTVPSNLVSMVELVMIVWPATFVNAHPTKQVFCAT